MEALKHIKAGEEYKLTGPMSRTLFAQDLHERLDEGWPTDARIGGEEVEIPLGVVVACLGIDGMGKALMEIHAASDEEGKEFVEKYVWRRFSSSPRTQGIFELVSVDGV